MVLFVELLNPKKFCTISTSSQNLTSMNVFNDVFLLVKRPNFGFSFAVIYQLNFRWFKVGGCIWEYSNKFSINLSAIVNSLGRKNNRSRRLMLLWMQFFVKIFIFVTLKAKFWDSYHLFFIFNQFCLIWHIFLFFLAWSNISRPIYINFYGWICIVVSGYWSLNSLGSYFFLIFQNLTLDRLLRLDVEFVELGTSLISLQILFYNNSFSFLFWNLH